MTDAQNFGFGKFVPGFDFLQNLANDASKAMPQMPGLTNWIAPTLSTEELDKRISELRAVLFWLEQNGKALTATIQALEVQKMTLATLKGMDVTMADLAESLKVKPPESPAAAPAAAHAGDQARQGEAAAGPAPAAAAPAVDPLQWWSALTQQFQQIASAAMQQSAQNNPMEAAREMASGMAKDAMEAAGRMAGDAAGKPVRPTGKAAPRKAAPRKAAPAKSASAARPATGKRGSAGR